MNGTLNPDVVAQIAQALAINGPTAVPTGGQQMVAQALSPQTGKKADWAEEAARHYEESAAQSLNMLGDGGGGPTPASPGRLAVTDALGRQQSGGQPPVPVNVPMSEPLNGPADMGGLSPRADIVPVNRGPQPPMMQVAANAAPTTPPQPAGPDPLAGISVGPEKNLTEQQAKYTSFVDRAAAAMPIIDQYGKALTDPVSRMKAGVPFFGNNMKSDDYRKAELAGEMFIMSILRPDTGATITREEMARYSNAYLPQQFDNQSQLDMKAEMRKTAIQGMQLGLPRDAILALSQSGAKLVGPTNNKGPNIDDLINKYAK